MKKITALLLTGACSLTFVSNSFGMLIQKSLIRKVALHKKTQFHTSKLMLNPNLFDTWEQAYYASRKAIGNQGLFSNTDLLLNIIQQNKENNILLKENNELLRAVLKQNDLHSYIEHNYQFKISNADNYSQLNHLHDTLEKKHGIKIKGDE